ncbi:TetR/AcrR family transcriptional regulator [Planomonospora sp. ID67723]|uniref:TetR/AcrR family transcriptional regulator n=1 Tax=Planomonospora sp. ID67723 TaxID=2738134 RepID=UPI001E416F2E|nr:TetR/AcrR family transcriptional regulator [Planomonospora sp. ID67723]
MAERRERLIKAAYNLYARNGFPDTTIEKLCTAARISNRAFYECFSGREELMQVVYDRCVQDNLVAVSKAVEQAPNTLLGRIEAGVAAYIEFVTEDPRRARILHLEVRRAGDCLTTSRQEAVAGFTQIIETGLLQTPEEAGTDPHLLVLGMIGALQELLIEWVLADEPPSIDQLIGTAVHIYRRSLAM